MPQRTHVERGRGLCNNPGMHLLPMLFVVLAAICFGTTGTTQALGPSDASSVTLGAARLILGGALLAALGAAMARREGPREGSSRSAWVRVLGAAIAVVAYQPLFFWGASENGVAVGTLVALGSAPALTGALEAAVLRRRPTGAWFVATPLAIAGVAVLSGAPTETTASIPGLLASVGAGAAYAVYALVSKTLLDDGWSPARTMGNVFGAGAVLALPLLFVSDLGWVLRPTGLATVAWLGVVTVAVAYTLFAIGLRRLDASVVSTITLVEPLTAGLLGVLVLREPLGASAALGAGLLVAGLVVLTLSRRYRGRVTPRAAR